jgi:hypothetical protein
MQSAHTRTRCPIFTTMNINGTRKHATNSHMVPEYCILTRKHGSYLCNLSVYPAQVLQFIVTTPLKCTCVRCNLHIPGLECPILTTMNINGTRKHATYLHCFTNPLMPSHYQDYLPIIQNRGEHSETGSTS